jgi:hypothetical protein
MVSALCGLLTKNHEGQIEFIKALPGRPMEARAQFMGPLQVAFELLFGKPATSRYVHVGPNAKQEADIRSDNGPEFVARNVRGWLDRIGVKALFIEPGSPWENGYCESFNSKLRD